VPSSSSDGLGVSSADGLIEGVTVELADPAGAGGVVEGAPEGEPVTEPGVDGDGESCASAMAPPVRTAVSPSAPRAMRVLFGMVCSFPAHDGCGACQRRKEQVMGCLRHG